MALTSKYKLAEQAQRIILGGNPTGDREVSIQELILFATQSFSIIVRRTFFEGKSEGESFVNGDFIYSFENVDVSKDGARDEYYSSLPETTVTLPYDMGVYQISRMKHQNKAFIPVSNGFNAMHSGMESSMLEGNIGYYREGDRIYYVNFNDTTGIGKVLMKLIAPIGQVDDEDQVNIPDDIQGEIVQMIVQLYTNEQAAPKDIVNDNVKQ